MEVENEGVESGNSQVCVCVNVSKEGLCLCI